jgi:acyl-coenzyme A thioesterase 9
MTTVQDRNNANNIFGGHLLRLASELAYATAVLHAGRHCEAVALGDVSFKQAVPIGCVLAFRAKVGLLHPFIYIITRWGGHHHSKSCTHVAH